MVTLTDAILAASTKAKKYGDRRLGEQNTKASRIEPLLEALGWDIRDPDEVHREFRPTGKDSPVDYALKLMRKSRLFVEAKGLGETLADRRWIAQVLGYATVAGVEWCVLTDGNEYRFYNATAPVDAEEKMFCRVRLSEAQPADAAKTLNLISRKNLEQNLLDVLWVSHFVDRRVKAALRDLLSGPNKGIVRLVREHAPKLSTKEIAESIRRLEIAIDSPAVLAEVRKPPAAPNVTPGEQKRGPGPKKSPTKVDVSLAELIDAGILRAPLRLFRKSKGRELEARLLDDGQIEFEGAKYATCSTAASVARSTLTGRKMATNGWDFWQYADPNGVVGTLDAARRSFIGAAGAVPALRLAGRPPVAQSG